MTDRSEIRPFKSSFGTLVRPRAVNITGPQLGLEADVQCRPKKIKGPSNCRRENQGVRAHRECLLPIGRQPFSAPCSVVEERTSCTDLSAPSKALIRMSAALNLTDRGGVNPRGRGRDPSGLISGSYAPESLTQAIGVSNGRKSRPLATTVPGTHRAHIPGYCRADRARLSSASG